MTHQSRKKSASKDHTVWPSISSNKLLCAWF